MLLPLLFLVKSKNFTSDIRIRMSPTASLKVMMMDTILLHPRRTMLKSTQHKFAWSTPIFSKWLPNGHPLVRDIQTTSFLTATTLIYATGAGITAAAGTRLALQLILFGIFIPKSFQIINKVDAAISCHYLPNLRLDNLRACCLPWM